MAGATPCDSARQHLWKLVQLVDNCRERFPYNACPAKAFTDDGMRALGLDWSDLEIAIGLPGGWTDVAPPDGQARMAFLRREIEPLDSLALERLLAWCSSSSQERRDDSFLGDLVSEVEQRGEGAAPRDLFLRTIMKRIERIENGED